MRTLLTFIFLSISFLGFSQNQALDMSSTGNEVNVTYNLNTASGFTVEQWVYIPMLTSGTSLVNQTNGNLAAPLDLYVQGDGALNLWTGDGTTTTNQVSGIVISQATWHHVAIVYDPADVGNERKIYIDGNSTPILTGASPALSNIGPLRIGRRADAFEGDGIYFDEVRVWSIARGGAAIAADYNTTIASNTAGLEVYLKFENDLIDLAGGDHSGSIVAGTIGYVGGAPLQNNALDFDGVNDLVNVGDNIEGLAAVTMEAWVYYTETVANYNEIFSKEFVNSWGIDPSDKIWFHVGDGSSWTGSGVASTSSIPLNTWTHVAVSWDGTTVNMYINGILDHTEAHVATMGVNASDRGIGSYGHTVANPFKGSIDELRAWSTVKTQEQIIADAYVTLNAGPGLLASYDFNQGIAGSDNSGLTSLPDISGNGANGTLSGPFALIGATSNWVSSTAFDNDVFAPIFLSGYPLIDNINPNGFEITVQLNEPGTYFYVVVPDGSPAPTIAEVTLGTGSGGSGQLDAGSTNVATASTDFMITASGLSPGTDYDLYIVAQDDEGVPNLQSGNAFFDVSTVCDSPIISPIITDNTFCVGGNGSLNITASTAGGEPVGNYTMTIYDGVGTGGSISDGGSATNSNVDGATGIIASNLISGNYTVQVLNNDNGCIDVQIYMVLDNQVNPTINRSSIAIMSESSPGASDGSLDATGTATGGSGSYTYQWYSDAELTVTVGSGSFISGLTGGIYYLDVLDISTSCVATVENATVATNIPSLTYSAPINFVSNPPVFGASFDVSVVDGSPDGLAFNNAGTKFFAIGPNNKRVYQFSLGTPWDITTASNDGSPFLVSGQEDLPFGLTFNSLGTKMYIVGDEGDDISQYSLTSPFDITSGVSFDGSSPVSVSYPTGLVFNPQGTSLFITSQVGADVHMFSLTVPFDITAGISPFGSPLSVSAEETSPQDLAFNATGTELFVMGYSGDDINQYSLSTPYDIATGVTSLGSVFSVGTQDASPNGFVFSSDATKLYVIGGASDAVNQYNFSTNVFTESLANDGSVDGALIVSIENETFVSPVAVESNLSIVGLPSGLTPSVALSLGNTVATITLIGNAITHESIDDIADLQVTFTDGAFTGGIAADVTNAVGVNTGFGVSFEDSNAPIAPTNLIAYAISATSLRLDWTDNSINETGFLVERADDYDFTINVLEVATRAADVETLTFSAGTDQPYFFRVTAINGDEDASSQSSVEFATTEAFPGYALSFDGVDDHVEAEIALGGLGQFTFQTWFKYNTLEDDKPIFSYSTPTSDFIVAKLQSTLTNGNDDLTLEMYNNLSGTQLYASTNSDIIQVGIWNHIAIVFDNTGITDSDKIKIYLNDQEVTLSSISNNSFVELEAGSADLVLGYDRYAYSDIVMDEFKVYDIPLTDFSDRFTPLLGNELNLVAYYPFDENTGTKLVDRSANTNDGTINGVVTFVTSDFDDIPAIITAISPLSGVVGSTVTITGTDFAPSGKKVYLGKQLIPITSESGTEIVFEIPNGISSVSQISVLNKPGRYALNSTDNSYQLTFSNGAVTSGTYARAQFTADGASVVTMADMNNDGLLDRVRLDGAASEAIIDLRNVTNTGYETSQTLSFGGTFSRIMEVADFNADGIQDILVAAMPNTSTGTRNLSLFYGMGSGTSFSTANALTQIPTGSTFINSFGSGDLNGNGLTDIVVGVGNRIVCVYYRNSSNTGYEAPFYLPGSGGETHGIVIRDINNDGLNDIAATDSDNNVLIYIRNAGNTGYDTPNVIATTGLTNTWDLVGADFDQDGNLDLVTTTAISGANLNYLEGNGDGSFIAPVVITTSVTDIRVINVGDVNGDGNMDIVIGGSSGTRGVRILLGNGDNTFQPSIQPSGSTETVNSISIADINDDGFSDLVIGSGSRMGFEYIYQVTPTAPTNLIAYSSGTNIVLEWTDVPDEDSYTVESADDFDFTLGVITELTGILTNMVTLSGSGGKFYRILAVKAGVSTSSSPEFATTEAFPGHALSFDGIDDVVLASHALSLNERFTVETWIKTTDNEFYAIMLKDAGSSEFYLSSDGSNLYYYASPDGGNTIDDVSVVTSEPTNGDWQHIAVTKDLSTVAIYINGVPQTLDQNNVGLISALNLGGDLYLGTEGSGFFLDGEMDEVRFWNRALTQAEIQQNLYNTLNGDESDLLAYYPFDENTGTITIDRSQNTNDGTISGATFVPSTAGDPEVLSVTASIPVIIESTVGPGGFIVTLIYNQPMDALTNPTITFTPDISTTLTGINSSSWSTTSVTNDTYTAAYDVADVDLETLGINVSTNGAENANGKSQIPGANPAVFDIDTSSPTVVLSSSSPNPSPSSLITLDVLFSEAVIDLQEVDFIITNAVASNLQGGGLSYTVDIIPSTDGLITVDLPASAAQDLSGNNSQASTQFSILSDRTYPTATIEQSGGQADPTNSASIVYDVIFSEPVSGFTDDSNIHFNLSTVGGTLSGVVSEVAPLDGTTYTLAVSGMTSPGDVIVNIFAGAGSDLSGNVSAVSTSIDNTVTFDNEVPVLFFTGLPPTFANSATTVDFTVTYSGASTINLTNADVNINYSGTSGGTVNVINGATSTPTIQVNGVLGNGSYTIQIDPGTSSDAAGNIDIGVGPSSTISVDNLSPVFSGITRLDSNPTSNSMVTYRIDFNEFVLGIDIGDFSLSTTGTVAGTVASVSTASGTQVDVVINGISGDGTLVLDYAGDIADRAGNVVSPFSTVAYDIDQTVPTIVSITRVSANPTSASEVIFRVLFSETVENISPSVFSLVESGTSGSQIASVSSPTGIQVDVTVNSILGDGTLQMDFIGGVTDGAFNAVPPFSSGEIYTVDQTLPVITGDSEVSIQENLVFVFNYSANESATWSLSGVDASFFDITTTPGNLVFTLPPDFEMIADSNGDNIYDVTVEATDLSGNMSSTSVAVTIIDVDDTQPTIISGSGLVNVIENSLAVDVYGADESVTWTLTGVDASFFNIDSGSGDLNFNVAPDFENPLDAGNDNVYDLIVEATDGSSNVGTLTVVVSVTNVNDNNPIILSIGVQSIAESATNGALIIDMDATDADGATSFVWSLGAGNNDLNADSNFPFSIDPSTGAITVNDSDDLDFSSGFTSFDLEVLVSDGINTESAIVTINVTEVDAIKPTANLTVTASDPNNLETLPVLVAFSENVTGFELTDITVSNGTLDSLSGSGADYRFVVSPTNDGLITISILADAVQNGSGNFSEVSNVVSLFSDQTAPTLVLVTTAGDPTNALSIPVTITFSEVVTGFVLEDLTLTNATATDFSGSGLSYTVDVLPTGDGLFSVSVGAGIAIDAAGNASAVSNVLSLTSDQLAPTITITSLESFSDRPGISGSIDDENATVEITIDGQIYNATISGNLWSIAENTIASLAIGTYDVIATATDPVGNIGVDQTSNELTILVGAPVALAATDVDFFSFTANWSARAGIDSYLLQVATDPNFANLITGFANKEIDSRETSESVTGLNYGTQYFYRVKVVFPNQDVSTSSNIVQVLTLIDSATALDSLALLSIYDAVGGANVPDLNWKNGLPLHQWSKITMSATRVSAVNLNGLGLTGTVPNITTGLEELVSLDLSNNKLTGVSSLTNLSMLTSLKLEGNKLGFGSLESNSSIAGLSYSPQDSVLTKVSRLYEQGQSYTLERAVTGSSNTYKWFKKNNAGTVTPVAGSTASISLSVNSFANEGFYYAEVTNSTVPGLTLTTRPIRVKVSSLERDRVALIELFNATKGSQWINNSGWNTAAVSNSWFGVTVTNSRVTGLSLPANRLDGNVPSSLADLASVKTIDLSKNDLRSFPDVSTLSLTALNISENRLVFRDLLPNKDVSGLSYAKQKRFGQTVYDTIDAGTNYLLSIEDLGEGAQYQWKFGNLVPGKKFNDNVSNLSAATLREYTLENIDINNQGTYRVSVTHPEIENLTIESRNQNIMAQTDFFGTVRLNETVMNDAEVFVWRQTPNGPFVKEDSAKTNSSGYYELKDIVLGSFVVVAKPDREKEENKTALQTYNISQLTYSKADTLFLNGVTEGVDIDLLSYTPAPVGKGASIEGDLEEEYKEGEDEEGNRVLARRKVRKAACSMRKFKSTGRSEQSEDELEDEIAYYIETDDEGYFDFTGVAEGRYSLNIEFPGVPMDPDAEVEFVIGGDKENQKFTVDAVVKESGIEVIQTEVLYSLKPYIKDLKLYPNPTEGLLQFDYTVYRRLNDLKVQLINTQGELLEEHEVAYRKATYKAALDLTPYSVGVYFIVFTDEAGTFAQHIKVSRK